MKRFLPKGEFGRNVLTLITGTTVAQFIPAASSPILTRVYKPSDFGIFALFMSISLVLSSIATGRYEFAIMSPEKDEDAINIGAVAMTIAFAMSLLTLLAVGLFNKMIAGGLNSPELASWLYLIPLTVLAQAFFNVLSYYNSRNKNFKDIASASVHKSVVMVVSQILIGLVVPGALGLVMGLVLSSLFANMRLLRNVGEVADIKNAISIERMKFNGALYGDFPKYSLWSALASTLSTNVTNVLISMFYSVSTLGFYAISQRLLALPTTLIGAAIGQVFFQRASHEKRQRGTAINIFKKTFIQLFMISVPIFFVAYLVAEEAFVIMFGEAWRTAGVYTRILMPLFAIRFIAAPLTMMNAVDKKNRTGMFANFILLAITAIVVPLGGYLNMPVTSMLQVFAIAGSLYYVGYLIVIYRQTVHSEVVARGQLT